MSVSYQRLGVAAACLGIAVVATSCYQLAVNLLFFFRRSDIRRYLRQVKPGSSKEPWALVTGSGSGIGRALAFELAALGFNIVIHGSNEAKLLRVQRELLSLHPLRSVRILVLDARIAALSGGQELANKLDKVANTLQDIQLRILINSVGMPQAPPELRCMFDTIDSFSYDELLLNVSGNGIFPLLLTRALYPLLLREQPALVVNIGSFASIGTPFNPAYGPAKAFALASAAGLRLENQAEKRDIEVLGIFVLGVTGTGTVDTEPNIMMPDATVYARAVIRSIGSGYPRVIPYLPHALFMWALDMMPLQLRERVICNILGGLRKQYMEKLKSTN